MIRIELRALDWQLIEPFEIARGIASTQPVIWCLLTAADGSRGRGEAAGVDYAGETVASMRAQLEALDPLPDDLDGRALLKLLPAGGARNALDCALWDLRAKQRTAPAWRLAGLPALAPVTTVYTIGLGTPAEVRRRARAAREFPLIKLKVDATRHLDLIELVRAEHPSARLLVDANQGWSRALLERLLPQLVAAGIELIEQPVPHGADDTLAGLDSPIPLAADESCTDAASLPALLGRYQYVNVKLDKCGGLTAGLDLCRAAAAQGLKLMVGNMCGSSLAMAPGCLVAQLCDYVDLDGPLLQRDDVEPPLRIRAGVIEPPPAALWG